jgi:hypothetical protein
VRRNDRKSVRKVRKHGHGHEYIIDHPRGDIFVWRIWLLRAGALVLNRRRAYDSDEILGRQCVDDL